MTFHFLVSLTLPHINQPYMACGQFKLSVAQQICYLFTQDRIALQLHHAQVPYIIAPMQLKSMRTLHFHQPDLWTISVFRFNYIGFGCDLRAVHCLSGEIASTDISSRSHRFDLNLISNINYRSYGTPTYSLTAVKHIRQLHISVKRYLPSPDARVNRQINDGKFIMHNIGAEKG